VRGDPRVRGDQPVRGDLRVRRDLRSWWPEVMATRGRKVAAMGMRTLGSTGVQVSSLCLGAMMFGSWGNPDHEESIRMIHRALDSGINFIDTADAYSAGESELIVGKALAGGRRANIVLATKAHFAMGTMSTNAATRGAG
jgi:aryl-alcohol dehydrogenase-like predicted oxidoreductase